MYMLSIILGSLFCYTKQDEFTTSSYNQYPLQKESFVTSVLSTTDQSNGVQPDVYWSMNKGNRSIILPDVGDTNLYYLPITPCEKGYGNGVAGSNALYLNGAKVEVAGKGENGLFQNNCLSVPSNCQGGLAVGMWLKIENLSANFCFFSGSPLCNQEFPGFSLRRSNNSLVCSIAFSNGTQYLAGVNSILMQPHQWHHLAIIWDNRNGIKFYINGSERKNYVFNSTSGDTIGNAPFEKIYFGKNDPFTKILVDEVKIWFKSISLADLLSSIIAPDDAVDNVAFMETSAEITGPATIRTTELLDEGPDVWKILVIVVCAVILVVIGFMLFLLSIRRSKKVRHTFNVHQVELSSGFTPTSNISSMPESSMEY